MDFNLRFLLTILFITFGTVASDGGGDWNSYWNIPIIIAIILFLFALPLLYLYCKKFMTRKRRNDDRPTFINLATIQDQSITMRSNPFRVGQDDGYSFRNYPPYLAVSASSSAVNTGSNDNTGSTNTPSNDVVDLSPRRWDPPSYESLFPSNDYSYYSQLTFNKK